MGGGRGSGHLHATLTGFVFDCFHGVCERAVIILPLSVPSQTVDVMMGAWGEGGCLEFADEVAEPVDILPKQKKGRKRSAKPHTRRDTRALLPEAARTKQRRPLTLPSSLQEGETHFSCTMRRKSEVRKEPMSNSVTEAWEIS